MSEQKHRMNDTSDCILCESLADFPAACETCGSPLVVTQIKVTIGDETATYTWDACENTWKIDGQNPGMPETISGMAIEPQLVDDLALIQNRVAIG